MLLLTVCIFSICSVVVFEFFKESLLVSRRVELDDFLWIKLINCIDVLAKFRSGCSFDFLDFLKPFGQHKVLLGLVVVRQSLSELV